MDNYIAPKNTDNRGVPTSLKGCRRNLSVLTGNDEGGSVLMKDKSIKSLSAFGGGDEKDKRSRKTVKMFLEACPIPLQRLNNGYLSFTNEIYARRRGANHHRATLMVIKCGREYIEKCFYCLNFHQGSVKDPFQS